jgi:Zn-dependent protease with chaperone function
MNQAVVKRTIDRMTPADVTTLERQPFFRRTVWKRNALLAAAVLCNLAVLTLVMALHADSQPAEGTVPLLGFHVRLAFDSWQTYFWLFVVVLAQVVLGHRQLAQSLDGSGMVSLYPEDKSQGRKFGVLSGKQLVDMVLEVAQQLRAGRVRRVVVNDRPDPNAYTAHVLGVGNIVVLHSNLLEIMPPDGVRAIVAHEVGHIRQRDSLVHLLAGLPRSFLTLLGAVLLWKLGAGVFWFEGFGTLLQRLAFVAAIWLGSRWLLRKIDTLADLASQQGEFLADAYAAHACGRGLALNALLLLGERSEALHAVVTALGRQPHLKDGVEAEHLIRVLRRLPPREMDQAKAGALAPRLYIEERLADLRDTLCVPLTDEEIVDLARRADRDLRKRQAEERGEAEEPKADETLEQHLIDWRAFDWDRSGHLGEQEAAALVKALEADQRRMIFRQFSEPDAEWESHPTMRRRLLFLYDAFRPGKS